MDLRNARATTDFVRGSGARETYGCRRGDDELVVYLKDGDLGKTLDLRLAPGNYDARVVEPASGNVLGSLPLAGGDVAVPLYGARTDVAVHVKRR